MFAARPPPPAPFANVHFRPFVSVYGGEPDLTDEGTDCEETEGLENSVDRRHVPARRGSAGAFLGMLRGQCVFHTSTPTTPTRISAWNVRVLAFSNFYNCPLYFRY